MIIIVEGPDGAGKSTLIQKLLASHPGSSYRHFGYPANDEEAYDYWKVYARAILDTNKNHLTIFDRSWYSDVVYGPIFRGRLEMDSLHSKMLDALVVANGGGHVVYCTAPLNVLWARCKKRGEAYVTSKFKLAEVSNAYDEVMAESTLPVIRYDTNS